MAPITEKAVTEQVIAWCTALILEINRLLVALPVHQDNIPPQTPQDLVDPFTPVPEIGNYTLDNLNAFLLRVPATTVAPSTQTAASGGITGTSNSVTPETDEDAADEAGGDTDTDDGDDPDP